MYPNFFLQSSATLILFFLQYDSFSHMLLHTYKMVNLHEGKCTHHHIDIVATKLCIILSFFFLLSFHILFSQKGFTCEFEFGANVVRANAPCAFINYLFIYYLVVQSRLNNPFTKIQEKTKYYMNTSYVLS